MSKSPCLINIPKYSDHRGNLSVVDFKTCLPFDIKRVFYVYDIPAGSQRGAHAHYTLEQFIWCVAGSISVSTTSCDGINASFNLSLPWQGLYLPPLTWANESALSAGCVYLVAASEYYNEADYIRDFNCFNNIIQKR